MQFFTTIIATVVADVLVYIIIRKWLDKRDED